MNLAQISSLSDRGQGVLGGMLTVAPLLQHAEFRMDASTHFVVKDADSHTNSAARAEGAAAGQRDAQVPSVVADSLSLYTREITIDRVRELDASNGIMAPAGLRMFGDRRIRGLADKMAVEVQNDMIAGLGASYHMLGLSTLIKDAAAGGQTAALNFSQAELAAMNHQISLQLNTTPNQDSFVESLEKKLAAVPGANAILCNVNLAARLSTIARRLGAAGESMNTFGTKVRTFNGVPIVPLPVGAIPQTESDGSNADCTSLYIVRFAEDQGLCYSTNSGLLFKDWDSVEEKPSGLSRVEIYISLTLERNDAVIRCSRIRL